MADQVSPVTVTLPSGKTETVTLAETIAGPLARPPGDQGSRHASPERRQARSGRCRRQCRSQGDRRHRRHRRQARARRHRRPAAACPGLRSTACRASSKCRPAARWRAPAGSASRTTTSIACAPCARFRSFRRWRALAFCLLAICCHVVPRRPLSRQCVAFGTACRQTGRMQLFLETMRRQHQALRRLNAPGASSR